MISFLPLNKVYLSFSSPGYVLFSLRRKGQQADVPDGRVKKSPLQTEDTHITPPHHCEMKASRLPTLPEEETSDLKSPDPVSMVREDADGKDDAAEVKIHNIDVQINYCLLSKPNFIPPSSSSSSSSRAW